MHSCIGSIDALQVMEPMPAWASDLLAQRQRRRDAREAFDRRRRIGLAHRHANKLRSTKEPNMKSTSTGFTLSGGGDLTLAGRSGEPWTPDEVTRLESMIAAGVPAAQAARRLGRTQRAVYLMLSRQRWADQHEYTCSSCKRTMPAIEFVASMQHPGGRCRHCQRLARPQRPLQAWEQALGWVTGYLRSHGGTAPFTALREAAAAEGYGRHLLATARRRRPDLLESRPLPDRRTEWVLVDHA